MPYLIATLSTCFLFFGFLLVTMYERERGVRFFAVSRNRLDVKVSRALFVITRVDWGAFTAHLTRTSFEVLAHDAAHGVLMVVRAVERFLTRAVRVLRMRRDGTLPQPRQRSISSRISGTVTHVKESLSQSATPRTMDDIAPRETKE